MASLASRSTSLLCRLSIRCCASRVSDSWRWPGIQRTALAFDYPGAKMAVC